MKGFEWSLVRRAAFLFAALSKSWFGMLSRLGDICNWAGIPSGLLGRHGFGDFGLAGGFLSCLGGFLGNGAD